MDKLAKAAIEKDFVEVAKIVGEPLDPKKVFPKIIELIADTDVTGVGVLYYNYDVDEDTKEVYVLADKNGTVTSLQISPTDPTPLSFTDIASREYFFHLFDLYRAKYDIVGKKKKAITRSLDIKEIALTLGVALAAVPDGNKHTLATGKTKFRYPDLIEMLEDVQDYGDNFVLIMGATIAKDVVLWNYDENKYHSLKEALEDLGIKRVRVPAGKISTGGTPADVFAPTKALLIALNSVVGKPLKFSRRELPGDFEGIKEERDDAKQRIIVISPAIMTKPGATSRLPSVGAVGLESLCICCINSKSLSLFTRA